MTKKNSKVRKVHINGIEWTYAISNKEVRIYEPGTKQIKNRIAMKDLPTIESDTAIGIGPERVKKYIEDNIILF